MIQLAQVAEQVRSRFAQVALFRSGRAHHANCGSVAASRRAIRISCLSAEQKCAARSISTSGVAAHNAMEVGPALESFASLETARTFRTTQFFFRDCAASQDFQLAVTNRNNGRFNAVSCWTSIDDQRNSAIQFLEHMFARSSG